MINISHKYKNNEFLILWLIIVLIVSCNDNDHPVPNVNVDITINVEQPSFSDLRVTGGWEYVTGGAKGIIVYRRSKEKFMAYDRYCNEAPCGKAYVDSSNIEVICDCDSTVYSITDGTVVSGETGFPLKRYNTSFDGSILRISN
ncbi:MAG: hypothetical protein ABEH43_03235 [Flavobacteriales bacterium]